PVVINDFYAPRALNQWYWMDDDGWVPYSGDQNIQIDTAFTKGEKTIKLVGGANSYEVDINSMTQKNTATQHKRKVMRSSLSEWVYYSGYYYNLKTDICTV